MDTSRTREIGRLILRLTVGAIFISHGVPKLLAGAAGTTGFLTQLEVPAPALVAWGVTLLEVVGGLLLVLGLWVTPVAILFCIHMLAGILLVHAPNGWYVVGPGQGGMEFNVLLIAASLLLVFGGPGLASVEAARRSPRTA